MALRLVLCVFFCGACIFGCYSKMKVVFSQPVIFQQIRTNAPKDGQVRPVNNHSWISTGRSHGKALLVGIERYKSPGVSPTLGGVNDALATERLVQDKGWFKAEEIKTLTAEAATAARIEQEFKSWLIDGTKPGDQVLFFYSGHGTQTNDLNGDEKLTDQDDVKDEAIAPYDAAIVSNRLINIITDDQFNQWIGQLGGRSIVMIFDSCHSGTVTRSVGGAVSGMSGFGPRYFPAPGDWEAAGRTRSIVDSGAYRIEDGPQTQTRNLTRVIDSGDLAPNSLVTIISAAKSYQLAYPMRTPEGEIRGALSYYLEKALVDPRNPNLTVAELQRSVEANIAVAQRDKRLTGKQIPYFEMSSQSMIANMPLFLTGEVPGTLPLLALGLSNPNSRIWLSAEIVQWVNGLMMTNRKSFCFGENVGYRIRSNTPGYLSIVVFSREDVANLIYPSGDDPAMIGTEATIDGFPVGEPAGKDIVVILLTEKDLDLKNRIKDRKISWKEMFRVLGSEKLETEVTRGIGHKPKSFTLADMGWQSTFVISEAKPCQGK